MLLMVIPLKDLDQNRVDLLIQFLLEVKYRSFEISHAHSNTRQTSLRAGGPDPVHSGSLSQPYLCFTACSCLSPHDRAPFSTSRSLQFP